MPVKEGDRVSVYISQPVPAVNISISFLVWSLTLQIVILP